MITLLLILCLFFLIALMVAFVMGFIAVSPIVLLVLGFILIDVMFFKLIFKKRRK